MGLVCAVVHAHDFAVVAARRGSVALVAPLLIFWFGLSSDPSALMLVRENRTVCTETIYLLQSLAAVMVVARDVIVCMRRHLTASGA